MKHYFFPPMLVHFKTYRVCVCAIPPEQKCCSGAFTCWHVHWSHCSRQSGSFLLMVQRSTRQECWCSVFKCGYKKKRSVSAFTWQDIEWRKRCWVEFNPRQCHPQSAWHLNITVFAPQNWIFVLQKSGIPVQYWALLRTVNPLLCTLFSAALCERGCTFHQPKTSNQKSLGCQTPFLKTVQQSDSLQHLQIKRYMDIVFFCLCVELQLCEWKPSIL